MPRRLLTGCLLLALFSAPMAWSSPAAAAQGGPVGDDPSAAPSATATASTDRPARGPALRERGGRRSRAGGAASGVVILLLLVGTMGWYVVKKLRR